MRLDRRMSSYPGKGADFISKFTPLVTTREQGKTRRQVGLQIKANECPELWNYGNIVKLNSLTGKRESNHLCWFYSNVILVMLTTKLTRGLTLCIGIHRGVSPGDTLHPRESSATNSTESRHRFWILWVHHQWRKRRGNCTSDEVPLACNVCYEYSLTFVVLLFSTRSTNQSKYFIPGQSNTRPI